MVLPGLLQTSYVLLHSEDYVKLILGRLTTGVGEEEG